MNKYFKQIQNAKTIIALSKIAEHIGVKLGRIKDINKAKAKLTKALEKERQEIKKDYEKIVKARESNYYKELKAINRMRNHLDDYESVREYVYHEFGETQSLTELNHVLGEFKFKIGDITLKDIQKVAERKGFSVNYFIDRTMEKIEKFNFENYSPMLEYYGFSKSEIKEMAEEFKKVGYKRQDYFLQIINDFAKGKNVYQETGKDLDHQIARSNFTRIFNKSIKGGKTEDDIEIDER